MVWGNTKRTACPVCNSADIENRWKIPMLRLPHDQRVPLRKHQLEYVPAWDGNTEYWFGACCRCGSMFTDPFDVSVNSEAIGGNVARNVEKKFGWSGYEYRHNLIMRNVALDAHDLIIDIGCGGGQSLIMMREKGVLFKRSIGIDVIALPLVNLRALGFEAYARPAESEFPEIKPGTADLAIMPEAFEHVRSPYAVAGQIGRWLKPGGWMYMTAQAIGGDLFINPVETVATTLPALKIMLGAAGIEIATAIEPPINCGRWVIFGRKR